MTEKTTESERIPANAKAMLMQALPTYSARHVMAMREYHDRKSHIEFLTRHVQELSREHYVGTIGYEFAPFMMMFNWAHRDKLIDDAEFRRLYQGNGPYDAMHEQKANLAIAAQAEGIEVIGFDTRTLFEEMWAEWRNDIESTVPISSRDPQGHQIFELVRMMRKAKELYDTQPAYRAKLDTIENFIRDLRKQGVMEDVASAMLANELAAPHSNMITISGAAHLRGDITTDATKRLQGVFDEGLTHQGWQVTDVMFGTEKDLTAMIYRSLYKARSTVQYCDTSDKLDALYRLDRDEVVRLPRDIPNGSKRPETMDQVATDIFSCNGLPTAEEKYPPSALNPTLKEEVIGIREQFRRAMDISADTPPHAPTPDPSIKRSR